jgi:hypothetical protein
VKFSIVIPTYKRVSLLARAVESALAQVGFEDYEVVVVDDCSPDETWEYLRSVESERLRVFRNETRLGMGRNWNKAVRLSAGEYVFILQDDDVATSHLLARAAALFDTYEGVDLICSATCLIGDDENERRLFWQPEREEVMSAPRALLYFTDFWALSSTQVIFSRALFERHGEFDLTPPIMSDAEAILRWMIHATTLVVPETLALRRAWSGSVTSATSSSPEMVETMRFLVRSVSAQAEESGQFDADQLRLLREQLSRSFVEFYEQALKQTLERDHKPTLAARLLAKLRSKLVSPAP